MHPRRPVVIEVTDVRALVPRPGEPEPEPGGLSPEVLAAIDAYADRTVRAAAPMDPETRTEVAALLRAGAPRCTGRARDGASGRGSQSAA